MKADLLAPAVLALLAATGGGWLRRRVSPRAAVVLLTSLAVLGATAVVWALALVVFGGILGVPALMEEFGWCHRVMAVGHQAPPSFAAAAAILLLSGASRAVRFDRRWRRTLRRYQGTGGVQIVATAKKLAFAAPGKPGTVVVSEGLLSVLDDDERDAVIAHEGSHLSQHHGRYLRIAGIAAAALPLLTPLSRQLRFATERAADEAAAAVIGDRLVVARAIARAVVAGSPTGVLAVGGNSVAARVSELLHPERPAWFPLAAGFAGVGVALAAVVASTVQLHHLVVFGTHVCGLS